MVALIHNHSFGLKLWLMKKMSLPEASAAPAVVTPSTPSAAPSAAKGVFARAVAVDEQSD